MIIRGYVGCGECSGEHIVRIGMGQEAQQRHRFACRSCEEDIEVGLDVDYEAISAVIYYGENAVSIAQADNAPVVNLDANFLVPADQQGKELVFPRLEQGARMVQRLIEMRRQLGLPEFPDAGSLKGSRRPNFAEEWKNCRAAWSLWRNGKNELSDKRVRQASADQYRSEPLSDLADWVFRLTAMLSFPLFEQEFKACIEQVKEAKKSADYERFCKFYNDEMSTSHGRLYFELMKDYFSAFDEFSQVHFLVTSGSGELDADASSVNFDAVKMFYGNAFEAFASIVEFFACINNMVAGRKFDEFSTMTRDQYIRLDKASRFTCFAANSALSALAVEADNGLRNASHHRGFQFEKQAQIIRYRAGKGGQGEEQQLTYTEYLRRSALIFAQAMALFRIELVFANDAKVRAPL